MTIKSLQSTSLTNNVFYRSMLAGNAAFSPAIGYFLKILFGAGNTEQNRAIVSDLDGNVFSAGATASTNSGRTDSVVTKSAPDGSITFANSFTGTGTSSFQSLKLGSSGDIFVGGTDTSSSVSRGPGVMKLNASGVIQWQRRLISSSSDGHDIALDASDNVFFVGRDYSASTAYVSMLVKYNSAGTLQFKTGLQSSDGAAVYGLGLDSSANAYTMGSAQITANPSFGLTTKYNSSGTLQWQRALTESGRYSDFFGGGVDSAGNVYSVGRYDQTGSFKFAALLVKYNSSGTLQWQRALSTSGTNDEWNTLAFDSLDNVYCIGNAAGGAAGGSIEILLAKYNSSGTLQWQRALGFNDSDRGYGIFIDANDDIHIAADAQSSSDKYMLSAKLPNDGSLTGTYTLDGQTIIYAASSLSAFTPSLTSSASSLSIVTPTSTAETATMTTSTPSLTAELVEL
jgi:hypothetical protein